jgi:hypothetical protein
MITVPEAEGGYTVVWPRMNTSNDAAHLQTIGEQGRGKNIMQSVYKAYTNEAFAKHFQSDCAAFAQRLHNVCTAFAQRLRIARAAFPK